MFQAKERCPLRALGIKDEEVADPESFKKVLEKRYQEVSLQFKDNSAKVILLICN